MKKIKFLKLPVLFLCVFLFATQAHALTLTIDGYYMDPVPLASGNEQDVPSILSNLFSNPLFGGFDFTDTENELYKCEEKEYDDGTSGFEEEGILAGYFETVFTPPSDPSGATIKWEGDMPFPVSDPLYLLVKDGNTNPSWYLYDLSVWDGVGLIELINFWEGPNGEDIQGAISHVSIYGTAPVPEPATMLLLGTGLIGLAGFGRKRFKKN